MCPRRMVCGQRNWVAYFSKGTQPGEDTTPDPCGVLPLGRSEDLYPHVLDSQPLNLVEQPVAESLCECAASRQDDILVEVFSEVQIRSVDGVHYDLVDAWILEPDYLGVEEKLGGAESLCSNLAER